MSSDRSRIVLPAVPSEQAGSSVAAWHEPVVIDTYEPAPPDPYPAYLERRVYQGSSGQVYPLPFIERISHTKHARPWQAIHLENAWVRLMILPELGGRIQVAVDKTNGYDFFYRNNVVKPALVGLAGPWVSGGVEFNWPQHHRPATFLPTDWAIEREPDGAVTVWCSDHDPFARMKGAHGIRLRPDSNVVEVRVRVFNRSEDVQTFLWWSNVAVAVNDDYQSFFPTDVHWVADHAKRATATFPRVRGRYYGVDYPSRVTSDRPDGDRIDWYRNIPVPTSYMVVETQDDFFGGYDHGRHAGVVCWADHRFLPGKKQWTWGNAPFGRAWDRQLTDSDGPYVELMAGAYTDNQPDFSFLAPGETKAFSQFWYPIQEIGPAQQATRDAALAFVAEPGVEVTAVRVGAAVTTSRSGLLLQVLDATGAVLLSERRDASPGAPVVVEAVVPGRREAHELQARVVHEGAVLVAWRPTPPAPDRPVPVPVTAPPDPGDVASVEELYLAALHLVQYRHATRAPEPYLREALRRDPADSRSGVLLAALRYRAARYEESERLAAVAVERLTTFNPNPYDGEAHYRLGLARLRLGNRQGARDAFAKAAWNAGWRTPALVELARLDARDGAWAQAVARLDAALATDRDNLQARDLLVVALRAAGRLEEADDLLAAHLEAEPLDWWAVDLAGKDLQTDAQTCLDVAYEYLAAGLWEDAARVAAVAAVRQATQPILGANDAGPLAHYCRARALAELGDAHGSREALRLARTCEAANCLPGRLDDVDLLDWSLAREPGDARAHALLGHWLYFRRRPADAREHWLAAVRLDPADAVSWRNLAVAAYNVDRDASTADGYYAQALAARPLDAKLWYERDQLAKRRRVPPERRLAELARHPVIVGQRDDLSVEWADLLTLTDRAEEALDVLGGRQFSPWEGGEGKVLAAWDAAHLALARKALAAGRPARAVDLLRAALDVPHRLGEDRHALGNYADLWVTLGDACAASGARDEAERWWRRAALFDGDFQDMQAVPYSEMTYFAAQAWGALGEPERRDALAAGMADYADEMERSEPQIDYFATSLPTMLLFHDDLAAMRDDRVLLLRGLVAALRGDKEQARARMSDLLARDPNNVRAVMWWRHELDRPLLAPADAPSRRLHARGRPRRST